MIISHIIGGLGNQLFQYAAGKCLATTNNTSLKLDISPFTNYTLRNFDLQQLVKDVSFASPTEINALIPSSKLEKIAQYIKPWNKRTYFREKHFHFDHSFSKLGPNVYLKGYFQSEKYFLPIREVLFGLIDFPSGILEKLAATVSQLRNGNSCSIHIRRGDITKNSESNTYHGNLEMDYYQRALNHITSHLPDTQFYLFSDDIDWARKNFIIPQNNYISGNITSNHFEDLYLMTQCRHNIIANSSFSWWGAWLNRNPGKMVIAPKKWFNQGPADTQDLLPEEWIKL